MHHGTITDAERTLELPGWANRLFRTRLEPFSGAIWAPADLRWSLRDQSRAGPSTDDGQDGEHFERLIHAALAASGGPMAPGAIVLALASGGGATTVFPCLNALSEARIVACDAGVRLAPLSRKLRDDGRADQVLCVLMDPQDIAVAPGAFDLVIGVSMLHRQIDPDKVIAGAAQALKPGGRALFLEPFDGHGLMRLAYEQICREAELRKSPLPPPLRQALQTLIDDVAARTLPDPLDPNFGRLDEKWLFSRESIAGAARREGFSDVHFVTHNDHWTLYRDLAAVQIRLASGLSDTALPDWAVEVLDGYDRALPPPVKRLLMVEGSIVLTR